MRPPIAIVILIPINIIVRVAIERQTYVESMQFANGTDCLESISALQALLEDAPPLPERKMSWHCAFEKLLDGTRDGEVPIWAIEFKR